MKTKTSITISADVLRDVDALSGPRANRSEFVEKAIKRFVEHLRRQRRDAKDLEIINDRIDRLNREAADVLEYQVIP